MSKCANCSQYFQYDEVNKLKICNECVTDAVTRTNANFSIDNENESCSNESVDDKSKGTIKRGE